MQSRTDGMQLWGGENEIHDKARVYVHATQWWCTPGRINRLHINTWLLVTILIPLKGCVQSKLFTLELTICG